MNNKKEELKLFLKVLGGSFLLLFIFNFGEHMLLPMALMENKLILFFYTLVLSLILAGALYFITVKSLKLSKKVEENLVEMSNGNFNVEVEDFGKGKLAENVKKRIETVLYNISDVINKIKIIYNGVSTSKGEIFKSLDGFFEVISKLKDNLEEQNHIYMNVISNIEKTTGGIQEIAASANVAAETSQKTLELTTTTVELASMGMQNVEESLSKMGEIKENTDKTAESVAKLEELANQIGGIIASITKVSEQTNLLALNAAIEAARAGEAGKGFAVVAQEIRGLADESRKAADNISSIVEVIQGQTKQAVEKMTKTSEVVTQGSEISISVGDSLNTILDSVSQINNMMHDVAAGSQEQSANTHEIAEQMDKITGLVNEELTNRKVVGEYVNQGKVSAEEIRNEMGVLEYKFEGLTNELTKLKTKDNGNNKEIKER
ncbi:methyl-accepting chemotaxis protein [Haliovirga abyssi]|uniref:Methyl-accepting transducer domain-containing protein n=1 Tax=Haliovirga abyssi TaxID=2996794 RepID=A0AAU9D1L3_9FUSO|nr:methyl-accepting chemotaxis protein [Haliovirga abyssi]BDU49886.1 hypothetical protein HLVA_04550 [Haliovirga abyssi]